MEFLLDNPVIAFIFLALLGITVLSIARIVNEVELNKKLRIKQQAMRIAVETQKGFARRLSLLGAQALAPVMVIAFAVLYSPSVTLEPQVPPIIYDSNDSEMYQVFEDDSTLFTLFSSLDGFREVSADSRGNFYPKISYAMILTAEMEFDTAEVAMDDTASPPENGTGSDDYSETNNQVDGVDELDDVLTDGKFIYSMYGSDVQITLAYTQEQGPSVLSNYKTLQYANENFCEEGFFSPTGMYVDDDYFIVLGRQTTFEGDCSEYEQEEYRWYWWWSFSETKALVYDKNNDFELLDEYEFAGDYIGTRKVGNDLYVITRSGINYQYEDFTVQESLPYVDVNGVETKVDAEDVYLMNDENPYYYTTFYGVNLDTKEVDMEVILGESGYTLYSSTENMYLVGTQYYHNEEQVVNDEGDTEIVRVYEHRTMIMRVGINDGDVEYNKIGFVEGFNLNQFSMDEYDNHFRIVTSNQWWGEEINNRLWVLDNDLQVVSVLEHIGKPGERVQSVRFMGEYAYIVTFLQTDPFYVINLSDPANPVKDGELEIPGFSSYLQPLGPDHMLGIGFDANDEGRTTGLKVSIYDISDKNNPTVFDEVSSHMTVSDMYIVTQHITIKTC